MKRINIYSVELVKDKGALYDVDTQIKSPECAHKIIEAVFNLSNLTKEHFCMVSLSTKNKVIGAHIIHIGSVNFSIVNPRDVYQAALLNNATSIIVFHNHPSGDLTPSKEDIEVTERLASAGKIIGIDLLDHLIVGEHKFLSMKEKGYM